MPTLVDSRDNRGTATLSMALPRTEVSVTGTLYIPADATAAGTFRFAGYVEPDPLQDEFTELADQWHADTGHLSSPRQIAMHPAYQRIIGMGERALPLILKDLARRSGEWFWALRSITGQWPVPDDAQGDMQRTTEAWLRWGASLGHIDESAA